MRNHFHLAEAIFVIVKLPDFYVPGLAMLAQHTNDENLGRLHIEYLADTSTLFRTCHCLVDGCDKRSSQC